MIIDHTKPQFTTYEVRGVVLRCRWTRAHGEWGCDILDREGRMVATMGYADDGEPRSGRMMIGTDHPLYEAVFAMHDFEGWPLLPFVRRRDLEAA